MIWDILWNQIGYNLIDQRNTVIKWISIRLDEFIKEKIGSDIKVERNNFKIFVKTFLVK